MATWDNVVKTSSDAVEIGSKVTKEIAADVSKTVETVYKDTSTYVSDQAKSCQEARDALAECRADLKVASTGTAAAPAKCPTCPTIPAPKKCDVCPEPTKCEVCKECPKIAQTQDKTPEKTPEKKPSVDPKPPTPEKKPEEAKPVVVVPVVEKKAEHKTSDIATMIFEMRYFDEVMAKLLPRKQMNKIQNRKLSVDLSDQQKDVAAMTVYMSKHLDTVLSEKTCGGVSLICAEDNFSAKCLNE